MLPPATSAKPRGPRWSPGSSTNFSGIDGARAGNRLSTGRVGVHGEIDAGANSLAHCSSAGCAGDRVGLLDENGRGYVKRITPFSSPVRSRSAERRPTGTLRDVLVDCGARGLFLGKRARDFPCALLPGLPDLAVAIVPEGASEAEAYKQVRQLTSSEAAGLDGGAPRRSTHRRRSRVDQYTSEAPANRRARSLHLNLVSNTRASSVPRAHVVRSRAFAVLPFSTSTESRCSTRTSPSAAASSSRTVSCFRSWPWMRSSAMRRRGSPASLRRLQSCSTRRTSPSGRFRRSGT